MKVLRSFIINFDNKNKILLSLVLIIPFVLILDLIFYPVFYRHFDKVAKFSKISEKYDVVIVGSSNILWDINPELMKQKLNKTVGMFSLPGGNIEFRFFILKDYLEKHSNDLPEIIIFHSDKYLFSRKRYPDDSYKTIQGYYHKNILKDYIDTKWKNEPPIQYHMKKNIKTFSLNSEFYFILARIADQFIPFSKILFTNSFSQSQYASDAQTSENLLLENDKKIKQWIEYYKSFGELGEPDPVYKSYFFKVIELVRKYNIKVILLDTPVYEKAILNKKEFEQTVNIFKEFQTDNIYYLELEPERFEKDISFYFDASHMNLNGRESYTKALINSLLKGDHF